MPDGPSTPLICHVCWPQQANHYDACVHVKQVLEDQRLALTKTMTMFQESTILRLYDHVVKIPADKQEQFWDEVVALAKAKA